MPRNSGFTLLESMVALMMLSGTLLLLSGLIQHAHKMEQSLSGYHQLEWEIFLLQLDNELNDVEYLKTTPQEILTKSRDGKKTITIRKYQEQIIKSDGYQPLLTGVSKFVCEEKNHGVDFAVTFTDGKQKEGTWIFE